MSKQNAEEDYITTPISVLAYIAELEAERDALQEHLKFLRSLVCDGAKEGFNPMVGDWAEKIFCSNGKTSKLIEGKGDEVFKSIIL